MYRHPCALVHKIDFDRRRTSREAALIRASIAMVKYVCPGCVDDAVRDRMSEDQCNIFMSERLACDDEPR